MLVTRPAGCTTDPARVFKKNPISICIINDTNIWHDKISLTYKYYEFDFTLFDRTLIMITLYFITIYRSTNLNDSTFILSTSWTSCPLRDLYIITRWSMCTVANEFFHDTDYGLAYILYMYSYESYCRLSYFIILE